MSLKPAVFSKDEAEETARGNPRYQATEIGRTGFFAIEIWDYPNGPENPVYAGHLGRVEPVVNIAEVPKDA